MLGTFFFFLKYHLCPSVKHGVRKARPNRKCLGD